MAQVRLRKKTLAWDLGKERFAWLLRQRNIPFVDETKLKSRITVQGTNPDFLGEPRGLPRFIAEVESLRAPGPLRKISSRSFVLNPNQILRRLRGPVKHAAKQLKPYATINIPMIVVLDNARRVGVPLSPIELIQLLGEIEYRVPVNLATGQPAGPTTKHHGSGQVLTPTQKRYISAIAVNRPKQGHQYVEPIEKERPMCLLILHNPYALVRLPRKIFNDSEDTHLGLRNGQWVNLRSGKRVL